MSRRFTLREACSQLGFVDELSIDDYDDNNEDAEDFIPVEDGQNDEEICVDDEGHVKVFDEIDDNDTDYDDGASNDENANADQSDEEDRLFDCIASRSGHFVHNPKDSESKTTSKHPYTNAQSYCHLAN